MVAYRVADAELNKDLAKDDLLSNFPKSSVKRHLNFT